jgi:hypothetical protein
MHPTMVLLIFQFPHEIVRPQFAVEHSAVGRPLHRKLLASSNRNRTAVVLQEKGEDEGQTKAEPRRAVSQMAF